MNSIVIYETYGHKQNYVSTNVDKTKEKHQLFKKKIWLRASPSQMMMIQIFDNKINFERNYVK